MKWYIARVPNNCSDCDIKIKPGDRYWGNSTSSFCPDCKQNNEALRNAKKYA